jgi:purine-cytosine permease-like protein
MKKFLIILVFICLYLLVGFFGLGPVVFADGSMQERLITLAVVILIFAVLTYVFIRLLKQKR